VIFVVKNDPFDKKLIKHFITQTNLGELNHFCHMKTGKVFKNILIYFSFQI